MTIMLNGELMSVDDVKPGMRGYALTVFKGTEIDTINVEVIDIVRKYNGSRDMILVKCSGENIEKTGIAQGMSGSPVYFDNKLAGSLSYTWSNLKEAIAGVTLIEDMLELNEFTVSTEGRTLNMERIESPIVLGGVSDRTIDMLKEQISSDIMPSIIASAGNNDVYEQEASDIRPGSAIAVKLVEGDMNASAIGTCTFTEGSSLYLFGHPFYTKGDVHFPVSEAYIYTILPRLDMSFKMGIPFHDNPAVAVQDRVSGLLATSDIEPDMIPVIFRYDNAQTSLSFVRDEDILSSLVPLMFTQSLNDNAKSTGPMTVAYDMSLYSDITGNVNYRNVISSEYTPIYAYIDMQSILFAYLKNIFKAPVIDSIVINAQISEELLMYTVKDIVLPRKYYEPGETVTGYIVTGKFRGGDEKISFSMTIPENVQGDSILLLAINGRDEPVFELQRNEGKYEFTNIDELNSVIEKLKPADNIILKMVDNSIGYTQMNKEYTKLPGTRISQMIMMGNKQIYAGLMGEQIIKAPGVVNGQISETIKIRRNQ